MVSLRAPEYKKKQLEINAAIEEAKQAYKTKVESLIHGNNMRDAWKGLKMHTGQEQTKKESPLLTEEVSASNSSSSYQLPSMTSPPYGKLVKSSQ